MEIKKDTAKNMGTVVEDYKERFKPEVLPRMLSVTRRLELCLKMGTGRTGFCDPACPRSTYNVQVRQ